MEKNQNYQQPGGTDIPEFCKNWCISRSKFYQLVKDGDGPDLIKVGTRTIISNAASARWGAEMEAKTKAAIQEATS